MDIRFNSFQVSLTDLAVDSDLTLFSTNQGWEIADPEMREMVKGLCVQLANANPADHEFLFHQWAVELSQPLSLQVVFYLAAEGSESVAQVANSLIAQVLFEAHSLADKAYRKKEPLVEWAETLPIVLEPVADATWFPGAALGK